MPSSLRRAIVPLLLCAVSSGAEAQRATGAGEDAWVLPRGSVRLGLALDVSDWDERFSPSSRREALGARVSGELTAARLAPGSDFEARLRELTGRADARLSLGSVRVAASSRALSFPVSAEVGVTRWMSVGVTVPFVRTRTAIVANADSAALTANAGVNPALFDTDALTQNARLVEQLLAAARTRESDAGLPENGCASSGDAACVAVREARAVAAQLTDVYGTSAGGIPSGGRAGFSPIVPLVESPEHALVVARIAGLREELGGDASGITESAPAAAVVPIGTDDLRTLVTDPAVGLSYDPFRFVERVHVGDVEIAARVRLLDGIGAPGDARPRSGLAMRGAITGLVRLPTGQAESDANLLDVGTGDGQLDLELRGALDVVLGRAFWITGVARATRQLADEQFVRAPLAAGDVFVPRDNRQRARRDLGDILELEATPRWIATDYLSVSTQYRYRSKKADTYEATGDVAAGDVSLLGFATAQYSHAVGVGVTYSTHAAARRGRRTLPMDITYQHLRIVRATGGYTPALASDQLRLRVFTRLGGR